jgi:hypothetical protein
MNTKKRIITLLVSLSVIGGVVISSALVANAGCNPWNTIIILWPKSNSNCQVTTVPPTATNTAETTPSATPLVTPTATDTPSVAPTATDTPSATPSIIEGFNISVGNNEIIAKAGKELVVPIYFNNVSNIRNCQFTIEFDRSAFRFVSANPGSIMPFVSSDYFDYTNPLDEPELIRLRYNGVGFGRLPITKSGVFAYIVLSVRQGVSGYYTFNMVTNNKSEYGCKFEDKYLNTIDVGFSGGKINVKN